MNIRTRGLALALLAGLELASAPALAEVNIYSTRAPDLIEPILALFTRATGIKVNLLTLPEAGITERLKTEGRLSPADLIITADIARLTEAKDAGVTQGVEDAELARGIPSAYRDPANHWFGVTTRARVLYVSKARVKPGEVTSYADLANSKWKGRVCTRSGHHDYNIALLSAMIAHDGLPAAKTWLAGYKANLARRPQGNDRVQVKAVADGICDIAVGNTYYYGLMLSDPEQKAWAEAVTAVFPNQADRGTHVNLSGMAMTAAAPHRADTLRLMRFMISPEAQQAYAALNYEYPILDTLPWAPVLQRLSGEFKVDTINLETVARQRPAAVRLTNEVDFDG
jgi:iron(III) transport system substrate-binding protein